MQWDRFLLYTLTGIPPTRGLTFLFILFGTDLCSPTETPIVRNLTGQFRKTIDCVEVTTMHVILNSYWRWRLFKRLKKVYKHYYDRKA